MVKRSAAFTPVSSHVPADGLSIPADGLKGLRENLRNEITSGLLVSLIALPLCLGIAMASGFPAFGGLITAIVGGLIVAPLCGSQLSIKGPAAGLIAIAIASVETLGQGDDFAGYRYTLAVLAIAAGLQIVFAILKLGRFGDFFPASVVHGMLAAIGIIIFSKQIHPLLGVKPLSQHPIDLILEIPHSLVVMNPRVALVGVTSVLIVVLAPMLLGRLSRYFPGPLLAVLAGICFCLSFDFAHPHKYTWYSMEYLLDDKFLVNLPSNFVAGLTFPDFSKVFSLHSLQFILMFSLIGSIESLLTVKAVDSVDPYKRRSNLNKDLMAVGTGNLVLSLIGGLPMISEVVRSYANVSYGAKTRWSNFMHGAWLLLFALALADIIHLVPVAALAGVLCVTGYRLAAPIHFKHCREIGKEQLLVFLATIIGTLMTDLLVGVFIGVAVQYLCCVYMGAPLSSLFTPVTRRRRVSDGRKVIFLPVTCFFGNVISFKRVVDHVRDVDIELDFSQTAHVDHTFMHEIRSLERELALYGGKVIMVGLDRLVPVSNHHAASRSVPADRFVGRALVRG
jgi:MFS superfamily sulfate permease-like transporter